MKFLKCQEGFIMDRTILHCDLNNFYASVECMLNPELKGYPVAVCGSEKERHGIVLAKNEIAKKAGVKTGEVIWQAKQKCKDIIILPPNYSEYLKYSKLTREIYYRYTDMIEPFGIDECWLDVTGSVHLFGDGKTIANLIREDVKKELGLTISVGVSFNKIFAKLGSDMKKPDAVTVISREDFKDKIWNLSASDLLGVGCATAKKLRAFGILTIGELANAPYAFIHKMLGKNGDYLYSYANGLDNSRVMHCDYQIDVKTVGHSITCNSDLENNEEVWKVLLELSQGVSRRLREGGLCAKGVCVSVKDNKLQYSEYQDQLPFPTRSASIMANSAIKLFIEKYDWQKKVRAVGVRAINLCQYNIFEQSSFFYDIKKHLKTETLETVTEKIRKKYGKDSIKAASLMGNIKMCMGSLQEETLMPNAMFR
jgi:DNA polymerase-4